jgi:hypothetical protein
MRKTILSLFGSTLIVASMANAAMAAEHHTRHHKTYAGKTYAAKRVRNAAVPENRNVLALENRTVVWPKDQYVFNRDVPWPTGRIQPDDPRQFGNR